MIVEQYQKNVEEALYFIFFVVGIPNRTKKARQREKCKKRK